MGQIFSLICDWIFDTTNIQEGYIQIGQFEEPEEVFFDVIELEEEINRRQG